MSEKPKKSKKRIPQWQFLVAWIGGQYGAFFGTALLGYLLLILMNWLGFSFDMLHPTLAFLIAGAGLGWFSGWVQQWSIRKHFGHNVKGWRTISAILTGLIFAIVMPVVIDVATNYPSFFENQTSLTILISATFMALFGAAGIGQAVLLRKHVKHSWLFFLSTLVGGIIFGLPNLGESSYFLAQIAQFSVTAFAILWLFGMSGTMDAMRSEDDAIKHLSDSGEEEDDFSDDDYDEEEKHGQGSLWKNLFRRLGFAISA